MLLADDGRRGRRPANYRYVAAMAREIILDRVDDAKREAGPDRRAEIKRHPGNLVLPLGKVAVHDPAGADVAKTLERTEKPAAVADLGPPSAQIHRDVDGHEKRQIAGDPDDREHEDRAHLAIELRQQPAKADPDDEEGYGPYRIFDGVAEIVGGQNRVPREAFGDQDQRHDHPGGVQGGVRSRHRAELVQDNRPLRGEADLGHGGYRPADDNARQPMVEQADQLHIRARQERPEGAAKNVARTGEEQ